MYKIVQTIEKGKPQLSIVPEAWESEGILYWPKNRADKLVKEAKSTPSDNWFQMPCSLKRINLKSVEEGEKEMEKMLLCDDTDDCEPVITPNKKRARVHLPRTTVQMDFNTIAQSCMKTAVAPSELSAIPEQNISLPLQTQVIDLNHPTLRSADNFNQFDIILDSSPAKNQVQIQDLAFPIPFDSSENIDKILKNQETIIQNQQVILNQLSSHNVMLEELFKKIERQDISQSVNVSAGKVDSSLKDFKPIDSLNDINAFESKLKHDDTLNIFVEKLSFICGKSGKGHGLNACYTIVDNLFTRKFMTLCSWAGGSRGDKEKIPFKIYKNVIHFFFKLVHQADSDFTYENCEQFFKNILKNSTRRNEIKLFARSSRCKNRPKKLIYKTKTSEAVEKNNECNTVPAENKSAEISDNEITEDELSNSSEGPHETKRRVM